MLAARVCEPFRFVLKTFFLNFRNHNFKLFSDAGMTRSGLKVKSKKNEWNVIRKKAGMVKR